MDPTLKKELLKLSDALYDLFTIILTLIASFLTLIAFVLTSDPGWLALSLIILIHYKVDILWNQRSP